jgi:hypothetical protein
MVLRAVLVLCAMAVRAGALLEEFVVRGPDELGSEAVAELLAARRDRTRMSRVSERGSEKEREKGEDWASEDSELMRRAKAYAVSRGETRSDEALRVKVSQ